MSLSMCNTILSSFLQTLNMCAHDGHIIADEVCIRFVLRDTVITVRKEKRYRAQ